MKHPHYDIAVWYFSDPENNVVQFYFEELGKWEDVKDPVFYVDINYRRKPAPPKRITINGVEINAPLSEAPKSGAVCGFVGPDDGYETRWVGLAWQLRYLKNGRCYATEQDAQAAYDAITLALTGGKQ